MKIKKVNLLIFLFFFISVVIVLSSDIYYKINKSYEIFTETLKILLDNYVLELDPEILIESAINGMLVTLDPYTVYYSANDKNELNFLTNSSYVGIGIRVKSIDSQLTIIEIFDGSEAQLKNIKIGYKILKLDSNYTLNLNPDDLYQYIQGKEGTNLTLSLINYDNDTLLFNLERKKITFNCIEYKKLINDSIGYIKLERFDKTTKNEMRNVLNDFIYTNKLKGVILDLSNNTGGLLDAAVGVCEFFLPENVIVVTTKNKNNINQNEYKTYVPPILPNIPLIVIINENSASASEIVAGALQDYDRALIVGNKSFGKGLVQNIFNLPYDNNIKVTTSKYFIPSGRCLQRLDFAEKYKDKYILNSPDTNYFYTKNGRKVIETSGIIPDTSFDDLDNSKFIELLEFDNVFFKFGTFIYKKYKEKDNLSDKELFKEFKNYLNLVNYHYDSKIRDLINSLDNNIDIKKDKKFKKTINELEKLEKFLLGKELERNKETIINLSKINYYKRYKKIQEIKELELEYNQNVKKSINLINSKKYYELLNIF
jgi:carboxyl-terminal processing protease